MELTVLLDQRDHQDHKDRRVQQGLKEWQDRRVRKVLQGNLVHKACKA
jgi:hypothetical protein